MIGYYVCGLAIAVALIRVIARRRLPNGPVTNYLIALLLTGGAASVFISPATISAMATSKLEPFPHFTYLIGSLLSISAAFCVTAMLSYGLNADEVAYRRTRRYAILLALCSAAMVSLLLSLRPEPAEDFLATYGSDGRVVAYQIIYIGFIALAACEFIVFITAYLRDRAPRRLVKVGLQLEIGGGICATIWCLWTLAHSLAGAFGGITSIKWDAVSEVISAVCLSLMALGAACAWTMWTTPLRSLADKLWEFHMCRVLRPLWLRLSIVGTQWALPIPGLGLVRRVVEIRDFQYRLRGYVHPDVQAWARARAELEGLSQEDADALVEAVAIQSAVDAFEAGHFYGAYLVDTPSGVTIDSDDENLLMADARSLARVDEMIRTSPIVRQLCAQVASARD
ncbi:MAB_1171c family putative transporter [Amycolatopsis sp. NPDC059657]|uniref:MAB_1171c family putative transporter n=1 Tax=Amycolatopsis sp. NPDC059657 TaxID=3346899 RepID=UPI00366D3890